MVAISMKAVPPNWNVRRFTCLGVGACCLVAGHSFGQVTLVSNEVSLACFGGPTVMVPLTVANEGESAVEAALRYRVFQASSSTAVPFGPAREWKALSLPPQVRVLESLRLDLPAVRARTTFLIRWSDSDGRSIGLTHLSVYPTNLLRAIEAIAEGQPVGLLDPDRHWASLLETQGIKLQSLAPGNAAGFTGKLALLYPAARERFPSAGVRQARDLAKNGTGVVLVMPPGTDHDVPRPIVYPVAVGRGTIVVAAPEYLGDLQTDPESCLRLLALARWAVSGPSLQLPTPY